MSKPKREDIINTTIGKSYKDKIRAMAKSENRTMTEMLRKWADEKWAKYLKNKGDGK